MILKNSLYQISGTEPTEKGFRYTLLLHAGHIIYQAHFPGQPITPGVCIIQIAKELLEESLGTPLEVQQVKNVKFLSVISPAETPCVCYEINNIKEMENGIKAQCVVSANNTTLAKVSFICQK